MHVLSVTTSDLPFSIAGMGIMHWEEMASCIMDCAWLDCRIGRNSKEKLGDCIVAFSKCLFGFQVISIVLKLYAGSLVYPCTLNMLPLLCVTLQGDWYLGC